MSVPISVGQRRRGTRPRSETSVASMSGESRPKPATLPRLSGSWACGKQRVVSLVAIGGRIWDDVLKCREVTNDAVANVARIAITDDDIEGEPSQYDAVVAPRPGGLSLGQSQGVCISPEPVSRLELRLRTTEDAIALTRQCWSR